MTLAGSKSQGTDLHSKSASILGIQRDHAKILNYGRIYGAGVSYAAQLLKKFNPSLSQEEADRHAQRLYRETKGQRMVLVKKEDKALLFPLYKADRGSDNQAKTAESLAILGLMQKSGAIDPLFRLYNCEGEDRIPFYQGGTESLMFNELERIAKSGSPKTPALDCIISDALLRDNLAKGSRDYMTSRVNWVVQSTGADYLHLLLTCMDYLIKKYNISARFCISIHDEVRYLVRQEDQYRAALALQISNLWTRCFIAAKMNIYDLPLSVAFFSGVDIDTVLRKETSLPCTTPSSITPLAPGATLDIYQLLSKDPVLEHNVNSLKMTSNPEKERDHLPWEKHSHWIHLQLIANQNSST
jgi:DNA polymerase gamma 1